MIVKPAITWLTTDTDPMLINNVNVVINGVSDNPTIYTQPDPDLATVQKALTDFSAALVKCPDGGPSATSAKNNARLILVDLMRQLAGYVQKACKGDMTNLILSGFPVQKSSHHPIGPLAAPKNLKLKHGNRGEIHSQANPVFGAVIYTWRAVPSTPGAAPIIEQDTAANHTFSRLAAGVNYTVDVSASGTAGQSDWSNPASLFAD